MPYGGDAFLLTRHADVVKAFTDPQCGTIQIAATDVPRLEAGAVVGSATKEVLLLTVPLARRTRRPT
jgi:hypothetical protein